MIWKLCTYSDIKINYWSHESDTHSCICVNVSMAACWPMGFTVIIGGVQSWGKSYFTQFWSTGCTCLSSRTWQTDTDMLCWQKTSKANRTLFFVYMRSVFNKSYEACVVCSQITFIKQTKPHREWHQSLSVKMVRWLLSTCNEVTLGFLFLSPSFCLQR